MATTALSPAAAVSAAGARLRLPSPRYLALLGVAVAVLVPLGLVLYQSFLTAPFFIPAARLGTTAYRFIFTQPQFWRAFGTSLIVSTGMVAISVPLGSALAFLMVRTDLPGRRWL